MSGDDLTDDEVFSLLAHESKKQRVERIGWPGEDGLVSIKEAIIAESPKVELGGQWFKIQYSQKREAYFVKPERGFSPCGWFRL